MRPVSRYLALILLTASACRQTAPAAGGSAPKAAQMQTIETVAPGPVLLDPPKVLADEAPPPKPKRMPWDTKPPEVLTPDDEKIRARLPFAPAIAMDPVDGSKISIRATTPTYQTKNRIFYFASDENKRLFEANPEQYMKGPLLHL
jgi:YHS domain-containing protein